MEVPVGRHLHIPCLADGSPKPTMEWTKLGGQESQLIGTKLEFTSIQRDDAGQYECRAKNGVEKDLVAMVELNVLGK